ncbi:hypothetical protein [Kribbella sp. NPDC004536]|uniref:hypothetical protein n=1 Tax=Kribbella sp. NPDC004536 TaxID=3364106 RepID=UPI00367B5336
MAGIDKALADPTRPSRPTLEAAGLSDKRMVDAIADARSLRDSGWYRAGRAQIRSLIPSAVDLTAEQPKVTLRSCLDLSATVLRFQTDQKVVPISASSSKRVAFAAELRYATRPATSVKMWFLTDEKALGSC